MCHTVPLIRTDLLGRQRHLKAFQDRSPNDLGRVGNQLKMYSYQLTYNHSAHLVKALRGTCKTLLDWEKNGNTTLQHAHQFYEGKH